mmetsp:Transcript_28777/g.60177  ORF Transcript_28777/g.60177 Transcript_28777/m.60177 type:complete len:339 (+) Transcript_28777:674-1690(+)
MSGWFVVKLWINCFTFGEFKAHREGILADLRTQLFELAQGVSSPRIAAISAGVSVRASSFFRLASASSPQAAVPHDEVVAFAAGCCMFGQLVAAVDSEAPDFSFGSDSLSSLDSACFFLFFFFLLSSLAGTFPSFIFPFGELPSTGRFFKESLTLVILIFLTGESLASSGANFFLRFFSPDDFFFSLSTYLDFGSFSETDFSSAFCFFAGEATLSLPACSIIRLREELRTSPNCAYNSCQSSASLFGWSGAETLLTSLFSSSEGSPSENDFVCSNCFLDCVFLVCFGFALDSDKISSFAAASFLEGPILASSDTWLSSESPTVVTAPDTQSSSLTQSS